MSDVSDALAISGHCLVLGLVGQLLKKGFITRDEAIQAVGHANFFLAKLPSAGITDSTRKLSEKFLQDIAQSLRSN